MSAEGPVVVLGAGSSGEHFVGALRRLDSEVEIVVAERGLAGGDCSYYACMPTKTLLRPGEVLEAARHAPGAAQAVTGELDVSQVLDWRDSVTSNRDDSWHANWIAEEGGAELVRGEARVTRPGAVEVDGRELEYAHLVVATGSEPAIPPIDGIDEVEVWTNREAVWADGPPRSLVVLGAGPVGCELAQYFQRIGTKVTLLVSSTHLLDKVDHDAGELLRERFEDDGIELRFEVKAERVEKTDSGVRVHLSDGDPVDAERLLVATGRKPNVEGFGLEQLDVELSRRGIAVDERMRAGERVWAIGDPTGVQLLTHVGKYQARVAAANIAGGDYVADYRAIPAAVFTDPPVATVGTTDDEGLVTATYRIEGGRLSTYERPKRPGLVKLAADPREGILVGAVAVGPEAGEWLGQLTLAVRARVPVDVLLDTIQPYPTFSEAIFEALRELEDRL
jgi:pyruvate/2-oxoglutarate dehydrogenase complex dihydrolipoamide dehydrogenase (E3) component